MWMLQSIKPLTLWTCWSKNFAVILVNNNQYFIFLIFSLPSNARMPFTIVFKGLELALVKLRTINNKKKSNENGGEKFFK